MRTLSEMQSAELPKLERVRTLEYYDGPLVVEFKDEQDNPWLYSWCDRDENAHRWLVFKIEKFLLDDYLAGKKDFLALILGKLEWFFVDTDKDFNQTCWRANEIPAEYMPQGECFYDAEDAEW